MLENFGREPRRSGAQMMPRDRTLAGRLRSSHHAAERTSPEYPSRAKFFGADFMAFWAGTASADRCLTRRKRLQLLTIASDEAMFGHMFGPMCTKSGLRYRCPDMPRYRTQCCG